MYWPSSLDFSLICTLKWKSSFTRAWQVYILKWNLLSVKKNIIHSKPRSVNHGINIQKNQMAICNKIHLADSPLPCSQGTYKPYANGIININIWLRMLKCFNFNCTSTAAGYYRCPAMSISSKYNWLEEIFSCNVYGSIICASA